MTITKDQIVELLLNNDRAVRRALIVLFERQTPTEKSMHRTNTTNARGFNQFDARIMTSMAEWCIRTDRDLSPKQLAYLRGKGRIQKYWKQLIEASSDKSGQTTATV